MIGEGVSIVVLTFNRRDELLRTLAQLAHVDESVRIVVADNASTDGTAEAVARCYPHVDVVRLPRNLGAAGRNARAPARHRTSRSATTTRGGRRDRSTSRPTCWIGIRRSLP